MIAQIIRAFLLASATAAILVLRRAISCTSHGRLDPCRSAYRITASAPTTSSWRRSQLPCLVIPPSRSLPPLEFCFGTRPIQAERLRPDLKACGSGTLATIALASTGPTPGTAISRRPTSVDRALARIMRSVSRAWRFTRSS